MKSDNNIKLLAFYLPQYHVFPENDLWWGKDFTEWVNVKKAKPLFKNHNQPRVPINEDYYDLSNDETMMKQFDMAQKYGLYGFCYYHYWFDGKLLLNKPLERMLKMEKKINYCFCWANEPWTRSWDGCENEVLMPQEYRGEEDWSAHFNYLLPFFQDDYYIKLDNRPMLVLYRTNNIPDCDKMIDYWDNECKKIGFDGIYVVEEKNSFQNEWICSNAKAGFEFEPMYTLKYGRLFWERCVDKLVCFFYNKKNDSHLLVYNYDKIWKNIIKRRRKDNARHMFLGGFVDWDNTPRKGKKGTVIRGANPQKFEKNLLQLIKKADELDSEFIFINAWNEWGEGTYLEADQKYQYEYLEALKKAQRG